MRTYHHAIPYLPLPSSRSARAGFSLVELMVAVGVAGLLVLGALQIFVQQRLALKSSQIVSETGQNIRTAMDMLVRDIRMAGYGLEINPDDLPDWVDWAVDLQGNQVTMDSNPKIVDGGTGSDAIWVAAAFEGAVATNSVDADSGTTSLVLGSGEAAAFNLTDQKLIFIGRVETARITGIAGDILTVSTHPTMNRGFQFDHPAGSQVELIKVRSYETNEGNGQYPFKPYLTRDESIGGDILFYWERLIAAGVEDVQFDRSGDGVTVTLTGVAGTTDRNYHVGTDGSKIRRKTISTSAYLRNPST